jgi:hypothetical protein
MFIDQATNRRVNIYAPYKGFSKLDTPEIRQRAGVIEIPDPTPPEDYSDETYYRTEQDDAPYVIFTKKSPEQLLALRVSKLKQIRDELTESGGCLVQGKWYHTDVKSKQQQMALAMAGANLPLNLLWKTLDGSFIEMTPELATELFAAQMTREATIFGLCEAKQHDDTPINEGWPERYVKEVVVVDEPVLP